MDPVVGQTANGTTTFQGGMATTIPAPQSTNVSQAAPVQGNGVLSVSNPTSPTLPNVPSSPVIAPSVSPTPSSPQVRSVRGMAIDLLPEMSDTQVKKIEKKGKSNVFAVLLIFSVVAATLGVLVLNLITKAELNMRTQQLAKEEDKIVSLQYIEMKQRILVTKINAYKAVKDFDFSPDVVLNYLLEIASGISTVKSISLNEKLEFSLNGTADSYINVARLWHDMASQEEYFGTITLDNVTMVDTAESGPIVNFTFSGTMVRENVDKL